VVMWASTIKRSTLIKKNIINNIKR